MLTVKHYETPAGRRYYLEDAGRYGTRGSGQG